MFTQRSRQPGSTRWKRCVQNNRFDLNEIDDRSGRLSIEPTAFTVYDTESYSITAQARASEPGPMWQETLSDRWST